MQVKGGKPVILTAGQTFYEGPTTFTLLVETQVVPSHKIPGVPGEGQRRSGACPVGRLKAGVPLERAQTEMTVIARRLEQQFPETNKGRSVAVTKLRDEMVGNVRVMLYLLLGAVTVLLLIACANTATLLLGKATARTREVAVRAALGASRKRIVRQLVTESVLLAFVAGLSGLMLAYWASKILVALAPADVPRLAETGIDRWVLGFTLGMSMITSVLFGAVPAFYASKVELSDALKQGGTRITTGGRSAGIRGGLVVTEIALAVTLVSAAGLLMKSFVALHNALPAQPDRSRAPSVVLSIVAPGTFAALRIPLQRGRDFSDSDTFDRPFVAVVNDAWFENHFPTRIRSAGPSSVPSIR
jgi:FtsX-like permease family